MELLELGVVPVVSIVVICYLIAEAAKATALNNKWLPVICGGVGAILGVVGMYVMPEFPAKDIMTALAVGIVSGFAATGVNQAARQLRNK